MSPSENALCKLCSVPRDQTQVDFMEDQFEMREAETHDESFERVIRRQRDAVQRVFGAIVH